jgi:hypothetical protein
MRWTGLPESMAAHGIHTRFDPKHVGLETRGKTWSVWEDNIKKGFAEIGWEGVD